MNDQMKWSSARLWDMPCYSPLPIVLALATARFYCRHVGPRSEALTGRHPCGRGPGVGWRNRALYSKPPIWAKKKRVLALSPVSVGKLFRSKIAKTKLRQNAL